MKQPWSMARRSIQYSAWRYGGGAPFALVACLFISHKDVAAQHTPTVPTEQQSGDARRFNEMQQKSERPSRQAESSVTLTVRDSTIGYVIRAIGKQMNVPVVFNNADPRFAKRISVSVTEESPMGAFASVLQGTGLCATVAKDGRTIVVGDRPGPGKERDSVATGRVIGAVFDSATGKPIAGVTVEMAQFKKRVLTGENGTFVLDGIAVGSSVVAVRFIGYRSTSRPVTVVSGQPTTLRIVMAQSASLLSGIVTTATGVQRKVEVGNDITTINVPDVIQKNPVSTVTDLLATRVPGLVVGRASGEPGAKTEIRIRGTGSIRASNAPILVVDGVQVASDREGTDTTGFAASPIDQLDVNSISTIEVLKGPSAVAMYGSNAANGVIVVTTKRGQEGPLRWDMAMKMTQETLPGTWPLNYFAWGEDLTGEMFGTGAACPRYDDADGRAVLNWGTFPRCRYDSTSVFQALNEPSTTVFGKGIGKSLSAGVSGGSRQFLYSITGSYTSTLGVLKLPEADADVLAKAGVRVNSQQRRPQALETFSGTVNLGFTLGSHSDLRTVSRITRQDKRTTPLIKALNGIGGGPPIELYDDDGALLGVGSGLLISVPDLLAIQNLIELRFANSATFTTTLWDALRFETIAGLDVSNGRETYLLKSGDYCPVSGAINVVFGICAPRPGTEYDYKSHQTAGVATDLAVRASGTPRGYKWLNVTPRVGLNITGATGSQSGIGAKGLPVGGLGIRGAKTVEALYDGQLGRRTVGMYAEASLNVADRLFLPFSVRTDVGSAIGSLSKPAFPRLGFSYLLSDEPRFRNIPVVGMLPELRLRTGFGVSGRQPGLADKHRTFVFTRFPVENVDVPIANINSVGNSKLSPEFVREWEMGFDVTVIDRPRQRWSGTVTLVRKHTSNLLAMQDLPPSLGKIAQRVANIGDVTNQLLEVAFEGFHRIGWLDWSTTNVLSTEHSKLVRLNGEQPLSLFSISNRTASPLNRVGYPLNAMWARPIAGYIDGNGNGLLESNEVVYGETLRYLGSPAPRFTTTSNQQLTVASQLTLTAVVSYENGATSKYDILSGRSSRVMNDPTVSLEEQARLLYDGAATSYRGSTLRLQTMQLTYMVSPKITTRYLARRSLQIAVSGTNLGIWSTFAAPDPTVGGILRSQIKPILPTPRTYGITLGIQ